MFDDELALEMRLRRQGSNPIQQPLNFTPGQPLWCMYSAPLISPVW